MLHTTRSMPLLAAVGDHQDQNNSGVSERAQRRYTPSPPAITAQLCFATERRMPFFGLVAVLDEPRKEKGLKISGAGSLGTLPSQTNAHEEPRT